MSQTFQLVVTGFEKIIRECRSLADSLHFALYAADVISPEIRRRKKIK